MNNIFLITVFALSAVVMTAGSLMITPVASATTYGRRNPTDVILPDWVGTWNCNLDGRRAVLELSLGNTVTDNGNGTSSVTVGTKIYGRISDNGGSWVNLEQRTLTSNDPSTRRRDHILPLKYNNRDNWLLMMHTFNRKYASGYTTWSGIPFGLQCQKR
ncbi:MAG: hypothetical protein IGS23_05770 [Rivularia sp. T60_A2020_040]|nr:hypothetical protein [Rivularia sp. T60_A2020_040]